MGGIGMILKSHLQIYFPQRPKRDLVTPRLLHGDVEIGPVLGLYYCLLCTFLLYLRFKKKKLSHADNIVVLILSAT